MEESSEQDGVALTGYALGDGYFVVAFAEDDKKESLIRHHRVYMKIDIEKDYIAGIVILLPSLKWRGLLV